MNVLRKLAIPMLALAIAGCAVAQVKRDVVLDRSSDHRPEWVNKQTFERDGYLFLVGEGTDIEGYPLAQRMAKATAAQTLAEAAGTRIKTELTRSAQRAGVSSAGSFIQDTVALASEQVMVQDLMYQEDYREKLQLAETDAIRYRVVGLYRIPLSEVKAAKLRALEALQNKAVKAQDKEAEADAKRLLQEVKSEP